MSLVKRHPYTGWLTTTILSHHRPHHHCHLQRPNDHITIVCRVNYKRWYTALNTWITTIEMTNMTKSADLQPHKTFEKSTHKLNSRVNYSVNSKAIHIRHYINSKSQSKYSWHTTSVQVDTPQSSWINHDQPQKSQNYWCFLKSKIIVQCSVITLFGMNNVAYHLLVE